MGVRKLVTLAVFVIVVVLTARYLFWNDRRDVHRRLDAIARSASVDRSETPADSAARATRLGAFVTDDVIIRTDASAFIGGRPAVVRFVLDSAAARAGMTVSVDDVRIELLEGATATAFLTLSVSAHGLPAAEPAPRQVHATFVKANGEWLLSRGEVLRTLEPPK